MVEAIASQAVQQKQRKKKQKGGRERKGRTEYTRS
jgi:hypothetical protein